MRSFVFLLVSLFFLLNISCKKQREKNVVVSRDYAIFQQKLTEIVPLVLHITQSKSYLNDKIYRAKDSVHSQAVITLIQGDTSNISEGPIVFDLDFENTQEVVSKSGKVIVTVFQYSRVIGGNIRLLFSNFKIGSISLSGQLQISRLSSGNFLISQANFYMVDGGKKFGYEAFITYTIDRGNEHDLLEDDSITITDSGEFTNRNKVIYAVTNIGIIRKMSCLYIEKGLVELINEDNVTQVLDFGSGCDNTATVTYDDSILTVIF
jgi:hypothetical protein